MKARIRATSDSIVLHRPRVPRSTMSSRNSISTSGLTELAVSPIVLTALTLTGAVNMVMVLKTNDKSELSMAFRQAA